MNDPVSIESRAVTVRDAVFALLRAFDLTTVFGNPGSTELPMFRDFPADFRYVLGLQESVVVSMADGYAQARGGAALVNLHSATGVGHAMGSIFTAFRNQSPLLITAGQQARSMLPYDPFLYSEQATNLPRPYVKWACEPARAQDVPAAIARAHYVSMQAPRGPTLVSVPVDDWDRPGAPVAPRVVSSAVAGDPALLERAAAALRAARRPVIVVGASVARDGAWDEVITLAERHAAQVWASPMSARNGFPEGHRLFGGFLPADRAAIVSRLAGADFVLALGAPVFTYHVEGDGPCLPPGAALVQLIDDPGIAAWAPVGTSIVTNLKLGISALLNHPLPAPRPPPSLRATPPPQGPERLTDRYALQRLAALRPAGSIIVEEAPGSRHAMREYLPMLERDSYFTCASGGLGHGLAAAVGIGLAQPGRTVIALLGDGSAMYTIQGLWSAAEYAVPVTFVIINNHGYGALDEFAQHFDITHVPGTRIEHLDFCTLARGQGVDACRVERCEDLDGALTQAFSCGRPMLVEVLVTTGTETGS